MSKGLLRKTVRAFRKIINRWGDSKTRRYTTTQKMCGCSNKEWARRFALSYVSSTGEDRTGIFEEYVKDSMGGVPALECLTQDDVDYCIEEEMSNW